VITLSFNSITSDGLFDTQSQYDILLSSQSEEKMTIDCHIICIALIVCVLSIIDNVSTVVRVVVSTESIFAQEPIYNKPSTYNNGCDVADVIVSFSSSILSITYNTTEANVIVQLKSVLGVNVSASDVDAVVLILNVQSGEVGVIVHIVAPHNVTTQEPVVHQVSLTVTLYFVAANNVNVCVSVSTQLVCTAHDAHVVHQAPTVRHVSDVSVGVVTKLDVISNKSLYISPVNRSSLSVVSHTK